MRVHCSRFVVACIMSFTVVAGSVLPADATTLNLQVGSSEDDYKESQSGSSVKTDTALDTWTTSDQQLAFRFVNVTIPNGAEITSATLQLYSANTGTSNNLSGTVRGQKVGDAPAWTGTSGEISNAVKTTASVTIFNPAAWTGNAHNDVADVTSIVQEIVDQCGWLDGNALKIFLIATSTASHRRTNTYDSAPSKGAKLIIEYEEDAGSDRCDGRTIELSTRDETVTSIDLGWNGLGHNGTSIAREATLSATLSGCDETEPPCGECDLSGPTTNACADKTAIASRRCVNNTRTKCASNADCGGGNTCAFFFGSYVTIRNAFCVTNQVSGSLTGTVNLDTGELDVNLPMTTTFTSITPTCPKCVGDANSNDGVRGGTCNAGPNNGLSCDINGSSNPHEETSLDCPPGAGIPTANTLDASTTSTSATLTTASPKCGADASKRCLCSTCNSAGLFGPIGCSSNADCPDNPPGTAGICGGKLCQGGTNNGAVCTVGSQCPGGLCASYDTTALPNACLDDTSSPGTTNECEINGGEYRCTSGPIVSACSTQTDLGCSSNADCTKYTCSNDAFTVCATNADCGGAACIKDTCVSDLRLCFEADGLTSGPGIHSITAVGSAGTPVLDQWDVTLANPIVCIPPVPFPLTSLNGTGLPGPSRLELPLHVRVRP